MALKDKLITLEDLKAVHDVDAEEISGLKADLVENLIDVAVDAIFTDGQTLSSATGDVSDYNGRSVTDFVDTKKASTLRVSNSGGSVRSICYYDENEVYLSGLAQSSISDGDFSIPSTTKYIRYCVLTADKSTVVFTLVGAQTTIGKINASMSNKAGMFQWDSQKFIVDSIPIQNIYGIAKFGGNLIKPDECVNNEYVVFNTGKFKAGDMYFRTGWIAVTAGETYKANYGRNAAWYTSAKEYISGVSGTEISTTGITAPLTASYLVFSINKSSDGIDNPVDLYCADISNYGDTKTHVTNLATWCSGMTINWLGDSIVDGNDFDEVVCNALGLTKLTTDGVDGGINGSTIALNSDGTDGRNAICVRYANMPDDADIIAVSCGTNDWMYAWCPIGDTDSVANNTFYGALKTLCEGLINKYPKKLMFFTTPIKRGQAFESGNGGEYTADGVPTTPFSKNKYGKTLGDYADIIKEVCGYYSIPVLDMYRESLLNPHLTSQQDMFDSVLTHPNTTGQKIMARRIAGWITQLGYNID